MLRRRRVQRRKLLRKRAKERTTELIAKTIVRRHLKIYPSAAVCSKSNATNCRIIFIHFWESWGRRMWSQFPVERTL